MSEHVSSAQGAGGAGGASRVVVGLGSNLGDRLETLRGAVRALGNLGEVRAVSSVYETAPVGGVPQPAYLNAASLLWTALRGEDLLAGLLAIERSFGRVRTVRWGPRTLDLDLLWAADWVWDTEALRVPHPELRDRPFALLPLLDVAPDAHDPRGGPDYRDLPAARWPSTGVARSVHALRPPER